MSGMDTTPLPTPVAEYLADNRTELFEYAETAVGYETQNPPGRTVGIVTWLEELLDGSPLAVDRLAVDPEKPNLIVTLPGRTDRTVCFNGHLDTVPFAGEDWSADPLGEWDGDRLYGRGTTDMKGAVAAMAQVALAYARTGTEPPVTLQFAFVSDEETGGDAGLATVLDSSVLDPDACVVGETTSRNGRYSVSVADRGNIWLTIEASGTAAHGSRPMIGENAIDRLTTAIERLRSEFGGSELSTDPQAVPVPDDQPRHHRGGNGDQHGAGLCACTRRRPADRRRRHPRRLDRHSGLFRRDGAHPADRSLLDAGVLRAARQPDRRGQRRRRGRRGRRPGLPPQRDRRG